MGHIPAAGESIKIKAKTTVKVGLIRPRMGSTYSKHIGYIR
jgi:hypothetical protein